MEIDWKQPSHPDKIKVISKPGEFASYAVSTGSFAPGTVFARLTAPTLTTSSRAYSSVQTGSRQSDDIELNCDFVFVNHSCDPNLEFRVTNTTKSVSANPEAEHDVVIEIRVATRQDDNGNEIGVKKDEMVTFFYPSTEWDMSQPFNCLCNTKRCRGMIRGARYMDQAELKEYFINQHIWDLKKRQETEEVESGGSASASASGRTNASSIQ